MPRHAGFVGFFIYDFPEESHETQQLNKKLFDPFEIKVDFTPPKSARATPVKFASLQQAG